MSEYLTTREVADLLRLRERKVYDLASRGEIPCLKATGKLLFPREELRRWMALRGGPTRQATVTPDVVLGSHDPMLEWALGVSACGLPSLMGGSIDGLNRFEQGGGSVCAMHVPNASDDDWNLDVVSDRFSDRPVVLMHWARRDRGLISSASCQIQSFEDLRGVRLVRRQADSGAQHLLEKRLLAAGLQMSDLDCTHEARTETEAALAILEGRADVTFGLKCFAERYALSFQSVCLESFDLLIDRHAYFEQPFQTLLRFTQTDEFREEVKRYPGYDISDLGLIRFNGAL